MILGTEHVVPMDDLIEHENSRLCVCGPTEVVAPIYVEVGPTVEEGGCVVWVHHSLDGREFSE